MTLEGAINLNETNDYTIYTMNSITTGQYGVVVPKNVNETLNMLVDLHMKSSFDGVGNGGKTKEQLVSEIADEYSKLRTKYANCMLVMPMVDEVTFQTIVVNGDKQKMFDEVKKIGAITSELYKKMMDSGVDKQKIDQKIIIVEKSQEDEKFVVWLKEQAQMSNFVDGILYSQLVPVQEVVNPFVDSNSIFGPAVSQTDTPKIETPAVNSGSIFDNVASVVPASPVVQPDVTSVPVEPVAATSVVESVSNNNTDLFGTPVNDQNTEVANNTNVVTETSTVQNIVSSEPAVVSNPTSNIEGPKPVESSMLEGTIAFTPIPNHPNNPVENVSTNNEENADTAKNNKGFVNLLILLVVLVGVTIVSIELGKYLYSVYGA